MTRGRRTARKTLPTGWLVAGAVALGLVALGVYLAKSTDDAAPVALRDVHGIAASPTEPGVLFVATHDGLLRAEGGAWTRVGATRDDFMGFTMHPTDGATFYVSGHPRGGGAMGVRVSRDGGATWEQTSLRNVDLHALTMSPADPQRLWGIAQGRLHASTDGGATWNVTSTAAPPVVVLRGDPADARTLYGATGAAILRSTDEGATWSQLASLPAFGLAFDPRDARTAYAGGDGALWRSSDGGATWEARASPGAGIFAYLAVDPTASSTLYAATPDARIHRSDDAGATWTVLRAG